MKVRDIGKAILDFDLSNITKLFLIIANLLMIGISLFFIGLYKLAKFYMKFFFLFIIGAIVVFAFNDYDEYFNPNTYNYRGESTGIRTDGIYISDSLFIASEVVWTIFFLFMSWVVILVVLKKLEPFIKKIESDE